MVGWQRLSPRCDHARVRDALQRANGSVYVVSDPAPETVKTPRSRREVLTLPSSQLQVLDAGDPSLSGVPLGTPYVRRPGTSAPSSRRCMTHFPFALMHYEDDRGASAPIYSDSRLLPWTANVELVAGAFRAAADVMANRGLDPDDEQARRSAVREVNRLIPQHVRPLDWFTLVRRCSIAGALSLTLHWGTVGSAVVYSVKCSF